METNTLFLVAGTVAIILGSISEMASNGRNLAGWGVIAIGILLILLGLR